MGNFACRKMPGLLVNKLESGEHIQFKNQTTISLKRFLGPERKERFSVKLEVTRICSGGGGEVERCGEAAASRTKARKKTRSGAARIVFVRDLVATVVLRDVWATRNLASIASLEMRGARARCVPFADLDPFLHRS